MTTKKAQRITLFINPSVVKHAKAHAIIEDINFSNLVEKALIAYLPKKTIIKKTNIKEKKKR